MPRRKTTPRGVETSVLRKSARRCALCFHLDNDSSEKLGQIAHLDHDPSNFAEDNLAFLCLRHHTLYDSQASQHKNYTPAEVKDWRNELYATLEGMRIRRSAGAGLDSALITAELRRQRDLATLTSVLGTIHWPTLDEHVSELPYIMIDPIFYFFEGFHALYTSSLFHIYDAQLAVEMQALHSSWDETVSYGVHYRRISNGNYVFDNPNCRPFSYEQEGDWKRIQDAAFVLHQAKKDLLSHIRRDYVEIDIEELSEQAWKERCEYRNRHLK
jgi:hypothetical protein